MDRLRDTLDQRRHHIRRRVAPHERDVALLDPREDRRVQAGAVSRHRPGSESFASRPAARIYEDDVSGRDGDAGLPLPGLDILDVDRGHGLEVGHALQAREVEQATARDDATL